MCLVFLYSNVSFIFKSILDVTMLFVQPKKVGQPESIFYHKEMLCLEPWSNLGSDTITQDRAALYNS